MTVDNTKGVCPPGMTTRKYLKGLNEDEWLIFQERLWTTLIDSRRIKLGEPSLVMAALEKIRNGR